MTATPVKLPAFIDTAAPDAYPSIPWTVLAWESFMGTRSVPEYIRPHLPSAVVGSLYERDGKWIGWDGIANPSVMDHFKVYAARHGFTIPPAVDSRWELAIRRRDLIARAERAAADRVTRLLDMAPDMTDDEVLSFVVGS